MVLGHLPDKGPSCPVAQFSQTDSSRKSPSHSTFFPFPNDGAGCALGNFQHSGNSFIPFPRPLPPHNSKSEFNEQFLALHCIVSALPCTVNCGTLYRKVCFVIYHVQSIESATGGLKSSFRDISRMIKGKSDATEFNLKCHSKEYEYLLMQDISAFNFSLICKKNLKTCFHFVMMGGSLCRSVTKNLNLIHFKFRL